MVKLKKGSATHLLLLLVCAGRGSREAQRWVLENTEYGQAYIRTQMSRVRDWLVAGRNVSCSCGWKAHVSVETLKKGPAVGSLSNGRPVCPSCRNYRNELEVRR